MFIFVFENSIFHTFGQYVGIYPFDLSYDAIIIVGIRFKAANERNPLNGS